MYLAEGQSAESSFHGFDIFMILFTILTVFALVRAVQHKNKFAIGFSAVVLLTFLFADLIMILNWFGQLENVLALFGL
jgi:hypothetical protein